VTGVLAPQPIDLGIDDQLPRGPAIAAWRRATPILVSDDAMAATARQ